VKEDDDMGLHSRIHHGTAKLSAALLRDIYWVLDMDTAEPRGVVKPMADEIHAEWAAGRDPDRDPELIVRLGDVSVHDWLRLMEVDAVQRLRGWHRLRYGTVTVDARDLCEVRNIINALTLSWSTCEAFIDDLDGDERESAEAALARGECCYRCRWCEFLVLRDRIDVMLDDQGFVGGPYYTPPDDNPETVWRERVMAAA
jgi:hypothetical protein